MLETNNAPLANEEVNIRKIVEKYVKYWPLFLLSVILCVIGVFFYLRYWAQTEYEIKSAILVKSTSAGKSIGQLDGFSDLGLIKSSQSLEDEIGILTSFGIMEEVITQNAFNVRYYKEGNIKDVEVYGEKVPFQILVDDTSDSFIYDVPVHMSYKDENTVKLSYSFREREYHSEHKFNEVIKLPFGRFTLVKKESSKKLKRTLPMYFVIGDKELFVNSFLGSLGVIPDNETGSLLRLSFVSSDKKKGEDILSEVINTYIDKTITYENELAENTIKMIDNRLKLLSGEIEEVENTVAEFKSQNEVTDVASNADNFIQQSNDYKQKVADYQNQIRVMEAIEYSLVGGEMESTIGGAFSLNDPALSGLISQYNEAFLRKQQLSQSADASNPVMIDVNSKLTSLKQSILQNVRSTKNGLSIVRGNLLANASRYDAQIAKVPAMEKQLLDISREKSTKEGLYLYLLQKREEEVLSLAAPVASIRIVSYPKAGMFPISPKKKFLYVGAVLFALFLSVGIVYIRGMLNIRISSMEELTTNLFAVPIAGEVSRSKDKKVIVADDKDNSATAELFRLLRFNIDYLKKTEKNQTILVTSSAKGEGKTFIASNLAVNFATTGERVVVLAFDLREPKLMDNFNLPNTPGITDLLINKDISVEDIVQKYSDVPNLSLIGSGSKVPQVGSLMVSARVEELFAHLSKQFDRIIIDTAPIGIISDAYALKAYVDSSLYVVRKDVTKKEHLKIVKSIYDSQKLNNVMVVLNDTKAGETYGYGV